MLRFIKLLETTPDHHSDPSSSTRTQRDPSEFDAFWLLYEDSCMQTHANPQKCLQLAEKYQKALEFLFGYGSLTNVDLGVQTDVTCFSIDKDGIGCVCFAPVHVTDVPQAQRNACLVLADLWMRVDEVEITIDMQALTLRKLVRLVREASAGDMVHGLALWETLPCRIRGVRVIEPEGMLGWPLLKKRLPRILLAKLGAHCLFVTRTAA